MTRLGERMKVDNLNSKNTAFGMKIVMNKAQKRNLWHLIGSMPLERGSIITSRHNKMAIYCDIKSLIKKKNAKMDSFLRARMALRANLGTIYHRSFFPAREKIGLNITKIDNGTIKTSMKGQLDKSLSGKSYSDWFIWLNSGNFKKIIDKTMSTMLSNIVDSKLISESKKLHN